MIYFIPKGIRIWPWRYDSIAETSAISSTSDAWYTEKDLYTTNSLYKKFILPKNSAGYDGLSARIGDVLIMPEGTTKEAALVLAEEFREKKFLTKISTIDYVGDAKSKYEYDETYAPKPPLSTIADAKQREQVRQLLEKMAKVYREQQEQEQKNQQIINQQQMYKEKEIEEKIEKLRQKLIEQYEYMKKRGKI